MPQDRFGFLTVRVFKAGGALPVEGAIVRIRGAEELNSTVVHSLLTDSDGLTERVSLPTPKASLSQSPNPTELPYALYNVEVVGGGFYIKRLFNVAVFENTETLLPVNLIPRDISDNGSNYPHGSINSVIHENERLE